MISKFRDVFGVWNPVTRIIFMGILFLVACSGGSETTIEKRIQKILDEGIQKHDVSGVSAAVVFPDKTVCTRVSGISHPSVAMRPDMLFAIGSITKTFVATLALELVEEGQLSLDDPLSKWLPDYPHVDPAITIRQLLNHTSGIYMFWSNQKIWDDLKKDRTKVWTPEEVLRYIKEPYFSPGAGFRYSNTNYLLMAMIIEKATGSTLSAEFRKRFWQPLVIEKAYLSIQEEIPDNQAHVFGDNFNNDGSDRDLTFLPRASHESITFGSAGLFMTAETLARWCNALFEGQVLNPQSMNDMLDMGNHHYGLGVGRFGKSMGYGETIIGHSGANIGTSVYMVHLPEHHFSVVVMINGFNHDCSEEITRKITGAVLRERGAIGILRFVYYEFFPWSLFLGCFVLSWTIGITVFVRKRKRIALKQDGNSPK